MARQRAAGGEAKERPDTPMSMPGPHVFSLNQKYKRSESCKFRTSLFLPVTFINVVRFVGSVPTPLQFGWLKASKASARNWKPARSLNANFLNRPRFQFSKPGL